MSIGLEELSDDQLVELLNEACIELAVRDPIVRKLAQGSIRDVGVLLPEIRKAVKDIVQKVNAEELGEEEEEDQPPQSGASFPGSFTVPQNPLRRPYGSVNSFSLWKDVEITVPAGYGYGTYFDDLGRRLSKVINRTVSPVPTGQAHIFHVELTEDEYNLAKGHNTLVQFYMRIL